MLDVSGGVTIANEQRNGTTTALTGVRVDFVVVFICTSSQSQSAAFQPRASSLARHHYRTSEQRCEIIVVHVNTRF